MIARARPAIAIHIRPFIQKYPFLEILLTAVRILELARDQATIQWEVRQFGKLPKNLHGQTGVWQHCRCR